jgi:teichuronic acid biosynthesis glycosyltransferase TuaC
MKCLWTHNFSPNIALAGCWMYEAADLVRSKGIELEVEYLGNLRNPLQVYKAIIDLRRKSIGFDIVHAQFGSMCGYVTSYARSKKVVTFRGTDVLGRFWGPWRQRLHGAVCRLANRRSLDAFDAVITVSNRMAGELRDYFGCTNPIYVMPSGIDLEHFRPIERQQARQSIGCGDDIRPWILFASLKGLGSSTKRGELASAAFELVRQSRPDVVFRVITDAPRNQMPFWINSSDVVLLTSPREGWPNIIKEGLACNVPFVSTDVGDLRAIAEIEASCCVCQPDPRGLADALLNAIDCQQIGDLRKYVEPMGKEAFVSQTVEMYETLCRSND